MSITKLNSSQVLRGSYDETDGALNVVSTNSFVPTRFDTIVKMNTSATVEDYLYSFESNLVATVRIIYTDATKSDFISVQRIA